MLRINSESERKEVYKFSYRLSYEEAFETFLLLSKKWNKKIRGAVASLLVVISCIMLGICYFDGRKIHYLFIGIISIALLFYMIYSPYLRAKKGAKAVSKKNGIYKVEITTDGKLILPSVGVLDLAGDKDSRAIETEGLFIIRSDRKNTVCIPKRIIKESEIIAVRSILENNIKFFNR